ncbi:hypothetical protein R5G_00040 [Escherichia coli]|nr:hypothetical protein R5G_00040 [Escherichia coli]
MSTNTDSMRVCTRSMLLCRTVSGYEFPSEDDLTYPLGGWPLPLNELTDTNRD